MLLGNPRAEHSRKVPDGPPKKRSPALAGGKRRANRKSKSQSHKKHTQSEAQDQESAREFSVYDGGELAGFIEQRGRSYKATDSSGRAIGTFRTLRAAMRAAPAARGGQ